ncbi:hypothetical protein DH2020_044969 [Rehmannia glutinosa]|uniref:Uncharacterized protein n=1 Tax=Rehmannia glutinosa TaxID=99300 RepID=A0ABR0UFM3_REHGL
MWVDTFSTYSVDHQAQETYVETIEALKKDVSRMLMTTSSAGETIKLIDTIERLGLAYHFVIEIEEKLEEIYNFHDEDENYDLFTTALRFRLLRQHQYHVSCELLNLLKLAKVNFNYLQNVYKKEIFELSRWWDKFDLKSKLPYTRDRLIESFLVGAAFHFEPQYSHVRITMAKLFIMMTVMDDTYDNYATLEEAQLFTDILKRWDMEEIDRLPNYMKVVYRFIMSVYEDYECDATKQGKSFALPYCREEVKQLAGSFNQDLKWVMERKIPSFEDFMKNSLITSSVHLMLLATVPSIESWTKEIIDWLMSNPQILVSTAKLGRFLDDIATEERENKGGTMLTTVDYYMKQYGVSNKQEAASILAEQIEDEWKYMNKEWVMIRSMIPKEIVVQFLNYVRVAEVLYKKCEDGYTYPEKFLAPQIVATFVDPII